MNISDLIYLQNPWFRDSNFVFRESFLRRRSIFTSLFKEIKEIKQITSLIGLRRVGKSTLLKQVISKLLEEGVNPKNILFFSFDEPTVKETYETLEQVINFYITSILNKKIQNIDTKIYIFLDEIQLLQYWQDILKRYYDINQNIKFIVTGSSSLHISQKSKESLAGRIFERFLAPLNFSEYKKMSDNNDFIEFLNFGQFPELLELKDNSKKIEYLKEGIISKVIETDIIKLYGVRKIVDFERLFWSLLPNVGQIIESRKLSLDLNIKKATLFKYLKILEKSLLINKIVNLSGSFRSEKRLLRKLYPGSVNFLSIIPDPISIGFKVETYINSLIKDKKTFLFRERQKEIDFIIPEKKIIIEVKYQEKIHKEDYWLMNKFLEKNISYQGILITKNLYKETINNKISCMTVKEFEDFTFSQAWL